MLKPYKIALFPTKFNWGITHRGVGSWCKSRDREQSAIESVDELAHACDNTKMIFITAGMGGGTGTGAAPVIAKWLVIWEF
ncbi:MAG: hypothetical protein CM15mP59_2200 [Flavobacteriaceae bacterium]|nr:MAG: hypothetical protein CM15mP59_2200 [Flavobacteriaceae bacterium]